MVLETGSIVVHKFNRPCFNLVSPVIWYVRNGQIGGDLNRDMTVCKRTYGSNHDIGVDIVTNSFCHKDSITSVKIDALFYPKPFRNTLTKGSCGLI